MKKNAALYGVDMNKLWLASASRRSTDCQIASAASAAVSARRMRGPSRPARRTHAREAPHVPSGSKPPSGPVRIAKGRSFSRRERSRHRRRIAALVAENQTTLLRPRRQQLVERERRAHFGDAHPSGLFRRLDGIGAHPLQIDPAHDGAAGEDRLQHADAKLGRLLHEIVGGGSS